MPEIDYLLIGHITADITPDGRTIGGTVSYAARVARAFDLRVGLLTSAHPDELLLAELGEDVQVSIVPAETTTTYENIYTSQGRVQYVRSVASRIMPGHIPTAWRSAPLVHVAPVADEVSANIVDDFPSASIMLTPQGWMRRWGSDGRVSFRRWLNPAALRSASLVVMSEEDIVEAPEIEEEYMALTSALIVTQGDQGGRYYVDGVRHVYAAVSTESIDLTGAGDVFAAACAAAWHRTGDLQRAVNVAAQVAAWSITRSGIHASAPSAQQVSEWIASSLP